MNRTCGECGLGIRGRIDKKFCSDQCRTAYHNRHAALALPEVKSINHALLTNRRILERFASGPCSTIPKLVLIRNGYDFMYSTHSTRGKNGQVCQHVYEQAFLEVDADSVTVLSPPPGKITP